MRSVLVVWLVFVAMVVLSASAARIQAADLPDSDDTSRFDSASADEVELPHAITAPSFDSPRTGVQSEPPLPIGRIAVPDVFRPPTR